MGDSEEQAVEEKEEQEVVETPEEEFDKVFDEVTADEEEEATPTPSEDKPDEEGEERPADKAAEGAEEKPDDEKVVLEKRLKDTQAALTDKSQELAEIKKGVEEKETAKTEEEVMAGLPEDTKTFIEEYPEFAGAMKHYGEAMVKIALTDALTPYKVAIKELNGELEQFRFERQVAGGYWSDGKYFEGHEDAPAIIGRKEFGEFIQAEKAKDPSVETTGSPAKVIDLISRFKETIAKASTEEHDRKAKEKGKEVKEAAQSSVGQKVTTKESPKKGEGSEDDFDATWDAITQ